MATYLGKSCSFGQKDQGSQGYPRASSSALLAKKFSCCVSYCLVEVGDQGVQNIIFIYQRSKRCKSTTYSCLESTHHCWIIQLLEVRPDSWLGWFLWILKACLESHHHHVMVASNIYTLECSGSGSFNTWTEPGFFYQDVVKLVLMCCHVHLLDGLWLPRVFASTKLL